LLSGAPFEGYFIDAGTPTAWNQAVEASILHQRFDKGVLHGDEPSWYADEATVQRIHPTARVVNSMVSQACSIGSSEIRSSTLLAGAKVGDACTLTGCLLGRGASVGEGCLLQDVMVDHDSAVPPFTKLSGGSWPR